MNLTGLFQYGSNSTVNHNIEKVNLKGSSALQTSSQAQQTVKNPAPGQTISITNVLKALEEAKLPATKDLMQMVSAMMKQGMSIDKNSLLDMNKLLLANAGARPETVVTLKALNLPLTPENIQQFENYERYEHQILKQVSDVLLEIPKTYHTMVNGGQGNEAVDFYTRLLQMLTGAESGLQDETIAEGMLPKPSGAGHPVFSDIIGDAPENKEDAADAAKLPVGQEAKLLAQGKSTEDLIQLKAADTEEKEAAKEQLQAANGSEKMSGTLGQNIVSDALLHLMDKEALNQLAAMAGKLGMSEGIVAQIKDGSILPQQLLKALHQQLTETGDVSRTDLMKLFGSKEYQQVLEHAISGQWLLKPEDVADKKDVEAFYGRLKAQTAQVLESLGQIAKDTPLAQNLNNLQNNLEFMNQMNQVFQYIQLPLKLSGGDAHGDLYVYTNRRSKAGEDDTVSALLHLDMEHLGMMDIHVKMREKNVSTKFYLQNESVIDFIAEHISLLNERLQKRGYSMQAEMLMAQDGGENTNVIETLMAQEKKTELSAQYSFDVRA